MLQLYYDIYLLVYETLISESNEEPQVEEDKRGKSKSKRKRETGESNEYDFNNMENNEINDYNVSSDNLFNKKNKKSKDKEEEIRIINEKVISIIEILEKCIERDNYNFSKKIPALEKLKCLPYLIGVLSKANYSYHFLQKNGLQYIQEFLKRTKDGSLPCLNQIEKIIDLLDSLPITKEHLEDCQIGTYIADIEKNLKENKMIQRKAKNIYDKWLRIATGLDNNYASIETENAIYSKLFLKKKRKNEDINHSNINNDNNLDSKALYEKLNSNRKVPQKSLFDYTFKPENKEIIVKEEEKIARKNFFLPAKKAGTGKKINYQLSINEI